MMTGYDVAQTQLPCVAQFMSAYQQCDPEIRSVVDDMLRVYTSPEASEDEKAMAAHSIIEAVYPSLAHDQLLAEQERLAEARDVREEFDREEEKFSARVLKRMEEQGVTQAELAEKMGVSQPAVSNILRRHSRPQRKTVENFATALDCEPGELWPVSGSSLRKLARKHSPPDWWKNEGEESPFTDNVEK